jgi:hypothetical protein
MDLNERFNVLVQGVEIAQKSGVLTLDDAAKAKTAIDSIQKGENLRDELFKLSEICEFAQKKGVYNLADAHTIFLAADQIGAEIDKFLISQEKPHEVPDNDVEKEESESWVIPNGTKDVEDCEKSEENKESDGKKKSSKKKSK